ncbi:hypothetical protein V6N13_009654 [Hibiscus sabdariffa]|uniref:Uncharacterized protein n=2 Tax=Hibiscus sabdariffa TaxID=183260 RepID=A0ABR2B4W6_9ROSI
MSREQKISVQGNYWERTSQSVELHNLCSSPTASSNVEASAGFAYFLSTKDETHDEDRDEVDIVPEDSHSGVANSLEIGKGTRWVVYGGCTAAHGSRLG